MVGEEEEHRAVEKNMTLQFAIENKKKKGGEE